MNVTVNGEPRELPEHETVAALLARLNLSPDKVAVELNRRILRTERYDTPLKQGDVIEVVTFVGGG
ncbi:MAG TPA: sulfur carrier protein ThiS [Tepidisphaeraceae bacterium]|nr:sulfur carrier protein ThiS [Tepidisphaeraceae bacterium]